jgi:hypothetical protein
MAKNPLAPKLNFQGAILEVTSKLFPGTYALVGGLAVASWIPSLRPTQDLDFALVGQDTEFIKQLFPCRLGEDNRVFQTKIRGVRVDFLKPTGYPWNREAVRHSEDLPFFGISLRVTTPEYLILYKMQAERDKDYRDTIELLKLQGVFEKTRELVKKHLSEEYAKELDQWMRIAQLDLS